MSQPHSVQLLVRKSCGSCARVRAEIEAPVVATGALFSVADVDDHPALALEFGDRVPVVLVDDEEFACWEVDLSELVQALL
ncbi:glutaredoxin family protein [Corynebacterium sp.]|uniref:glutaredoxin family protein n=1 Tax=Corynebacterium sp. TaxID=1720 RepID=UPI0026DADFC4|nr:glutaredoxin family protein [Corynebacterium sp.]MDO5077853.1 glutaredoxin family protein [Corynebacterium sp.]